MNISEQKIEDVLRNAPAPVAPPGLKQRLLNQARNAGSAPAEVRSAGHSPTVRSGGWLRRWWPVLGPGAVSCACAAMLATQQIEIRNLEQTIEHLRHNVVAPVEAAPAHEVSAPAAAVDPTAREQQELKELQASASQLRQDIADLQRLKQENESLRNQLAEARAQASAATADGDAIAKAMERANNIKCINNLKQLGLAAKVFALDNQDTFPVAVIQMTNEMGSPKILVCPGDSARQPASGWADYTSANCSYEFLASAASDREPTRVMFRCPIHGSVGLCDGSVQGGVAKTHPEGLIQRNGILYYEPKPGGAAPGSPQQ